MTFRFYDLNIVQYKHKCSPTQAYTISKATLVVAANMHVQSSEQMIEEKPQNIMLIAHVTSLHDVMHSYAILDYIISLVNEMKFIHLYLFNYVNIDGN